MGSFGISLTDTELIMVYAYLAGFGGAFPPVECGVGPFEVGVSTQDMAFDAQVKEPITIVVVDYQHGRGHDMPQRLALYREKHRIKERRRRRRRRRTSRGKESGERERERGGGGEGRERGRYRQTETLSETDKQTDTETE